MSVVFAVHFAYRSLFDLQHTPSLVLPYLKLALVLALPPLVALGVLPLAVLLPLVALVVLPLVVLLPLVAPVVLPLVVLLPLVALVFLLLVVQAYSLLVHS